MNASELVLIGIIGILFLSVYNPQILVGFLNPNPVNGETITLTGKLTMVNNPPMGQIVLPVMVWGLQSYNLRVNQPPIVFDGVPGYLYYITRDDHVIMSLSDYVVGDWVKITGKVTFINDINNKQLLFLEYTSIEKVTS